MSKLIPGNQKHLTLEDRLYIEASLNEGKSFKDIAKFLCKDPTTISKEVKLHRSTNTFIIILLILPLINIAISLYNNDNILSLLSQCVMYCNSQCFFSIYFAISYSKGGCLYVIYIKT